MYTGICLGDVPFIQCINKQKKTLVSHVQNVINKILKKDTSNGNGWRKDTSNGNGWKKDTSNGNGWRKDTSNGNGWRKDTSNGNGWRKDTSNGNDWRKDVVNRCLEFVLLAGQSISGRIAEETAVIRFALAVRLVSRGASVRIRFSPFSS